MFVGNHLVAEKANKKKRSHRHSQSDDSAGFVNEGYIKGGKVRRKLQWSMKDLLASTSLMKIDNASVGSAEETCATETTVHSMGSLAQSRSSSDGDSSQEKTFLLGDDDQLATCNSHLLAQRKKSLQERQLQGEYEPQAVSSESATGLITYQQKESKGRRKLIPRLPRSFLEPVRSVGTNEWEQNFSQQPWREARPQTYPTSPFTPAALAAIGNDDNFSSATSLTPISPTRLSFDEVESPFDLSQVDSFMSGEISVVLFPEDPQVGSPLTPSPQIRSPPIPRRERQPHPFVLERIESENNVAGGEKNTIRDEMSKMQLELQATLSETPRDQRCPVLESAGQPKFLSSAANMKRTEVNSMRSLRSSMKSVPVDVDDVRFVDVEENLHVLGEMADEYLERSEYDEALDVLKEILRGNLEKNGYEPESVGTCLHNIGTAQLKRKCFDLAESSLLKAVQCRKLALGDEHLDVAVSLVQLGLVRFEKAEYDSALEAFQAALWIRQQCLGPRCLKVAKVLNNIGATLKQLQMNSEAIMAFEECLQLQKEALASIAPTNGDGMNQLSLSVASTLSNISTVKLSLGLIEEAQISLYEAYEVSVAVFEVSSYVQRSFLSHLCPPAANRFKGPFLEKPTPKPRKQRKELSTFPKQEQSEIWLRPLRKR